MNVVARIKKFFFKAPGSPSIWLATSAVIILIILLALTVYHAREESMVEQFSGQQEAIVAGVAARIEDIIASIERSMIILAKIPDSGKGAQTNPDEIIKAIYEGLEGNVQLIALLDMAGEVVYAYPFSHGHVVRKLGDTDFFKGMKNDRKPYTGQFTKSLIEGEGKDGSANLIVIVVPSFKSNGELTGLAVALISLRTIVDQYLSEPIRRISGDFWIVDEGGKIVVCYDPHLIGKDINRICFDNDKSCRNAILSHRKGSGEYLLRNRNGNGEKNIVAYAPIKLGEQEWSFAIATPYDEVVVLVRKTFINILLWATGLIIVVIISSIAISNARARRLRFEEREKRLQEREDWEKKLLREKRTVEGIIEGSPVPTFVIDKDHKVIFWNRACAELTGSDAKAMIGTDNHYIPFYQKKRPLIADIIINYDKDVLEKYYGNKAVKKSETVKGAYEARDFFRNLGGKDRYLYFIAAPVYDENGVIFAAIETIQDVSKEADMTKNLRDYAETLQGELGKNIKLREDIENIYNYLQSIIDSIPDKIFDINSNGIINYVSRSGKRSSLTKIMGKHFLTIVAPEHRDFVLKKWEEEKQGIFQPYELEAKARDGSVRNLLISASPVKGSDRYVLVQRDITDFKNLEQKYYEAEKLAAVGQLSAGIAHEVRNPLSSIKMSLQILEKRLNPTDNDLKRFKIAQREVEHLEKIVNDILIFARPNEPKKEPANLRKMIEDALAMVEKSITDKKINVDKQVGDIPPIHADAAMLEHAFINIYQNAIDAMEEGGILTISTNVNENGTVTVEIIDNGCGIDKEDFPHLFNPFFTRKKYGTGLGLSQVKKIIEQHGGEVEIVSKKGEGTRFILVLPG